jgi:hypothetical protein
MFFVSFLPLSPLFEASNGEKMPYLYPEKLFTRSQSTEAL